MKKSNVVLGIVIAIFVIVAVTILIVAIKNNKEKETIPENVDFAALSESIEELTNVESDKMKQITREDLESEFNLDQTWVEEYIGQEPYVNISSGMYLIIKATDGNVENVENALKEYGKKYDEMWKDYLAEEYDLVKNRVIGAKGDYVYFIVSDYAKDIVDLIK